MKRQFNFASALRINRLGALFVSLAFAVSYVLAGTSGVVLAQGLEFDEAEVFFELNDTDGDLGIHALIDGEPWKMLEIEGPDGNLLKIKNKGQLQNHGLTEIFFESAEPPFDELHPADFFDRFPEGEYEVTGRTIEEEKMESETDVTHVMPAPPEVTVNGFAMAEECDEEEPGYDATEVTTPVTIAWDEVTMSHPDPDGGGAGVQPPVAVEIHNYEVVVEVELEVDGEEFASVFSVILPPDETSMTIPEEFTAQGEEFKYEVLAREASFNQTAIESCFVLDE